jgi:hypothetical protein
VVMAAFGGAHGRVFRFDLIRFGDSFYILLGICIAISFVFFRQSLNSPSGMNFGFRAGFWDATLRRFEFLGELISPGSLDRGREELFAGVPFLPKPGDRLACCDAVREAFRGSF